MSQKAQARLAILHARTKSGEKAQSGKTPKPLSGETPNPNPPHGTRGDFVKVSVSLPGAFLEAVGTEALRRKRFKLPNATVGAVLREAVAEWVARHPG
jgi:hypothetical protein